MLGFIILGLIFGFKRTVKFFLIFDFCVLSIFGIWLYSLTHVSGAEQQAYVTHQAALTQLAAQRPCEGTVHYASGITYEPIHQRPECDNTPSRKATPAEEAKMKATKPWDMDWNNHTVSPDMSGCENATKADFNINDPDPTVRGSAYGLRSACGKAFEYKWRKK